jgi:hypothetical protein
MAEYGNPDTEDWDNFLCTFNIFLNIRQNNVIYSF